MWEDETLSDHVAPALNTVTPDHHSQRIAMTRSILANPWIANLSRDELGAWAAPVFRQLLVDPAPARQPPTE